MREIKEIIIHCSESPHGRGDNAKTIDRWHKERGFKSIGTDGKVYHIGYHYVILEDGTRESGRPESMVGAHCKGHNSKSLGICLIGIDSFTEKQFNDLARLVKNLMVKYDLTHKQVRGHYNYSESKTCPNFGVAQFMYERVIHQEQAIEG